MSDENGGDDDNENRYAFSAVFLGFFFLTEPLPPFPVHFIRSWARTLGQAKLYAVQDLEWEGKLAGSHLSTPLSTGPLVFLRAT